MIVIPRRKSDSRKHVGSRQPESLEKRLCLDAGVSILASQVASNSVGADIVGQIVPNDPEYVESQKSSLDPIEVERAWERTTGSVEVVVAVLDTGAKLDHADLYHNIWLNQGEIPDAFRPIPIEDSTSNPTALVDVDGDGLLTFWDLNHELNETRAGGLDRLDDGNEFIDALDLLNNPSWEDGVDTDNNGFKDDLVGWDFVNGDNEPMDDTRVGLSHGTHIAGIIGATGNNGIGTAGINWQTSMMILKVLDSSNKGQFENATAALEYATTMRSEHNVNVRVANNSFVGEQLDAGLAKAIEDSRQEDILIVTAAGNGDEDGGINIEEKKRYPAAFTSENIITVAAADADKKLAEFSNFGTTSVDLLAPGVGLRSTSNDGVWRRQSGTSMAAASVSGVAALIFANQLAANDPTSADEVRRAILDQAEPISTQAGVVSEGKYLDPVGALEAENLDPRLQNSCDENGCGGRIARNIVWDDPDVVYTVTEDVIVEEGVRLTIGRDTRVVIKEGKQILVDGDLTLREGSTVTVEEKGNITISHGIVVRNDGGLNAEKASFNKSGSSRFNTTRLLVQAGGTLEMSDSTMFWEEVHLNPGSTIAPGKVIGNTFAADVYLQATTIPALENNDSFTNVRILGGELTDGNLTLNVMGTNSQADMRFFVQNDLTIQETATLRIGQNVNLRLTEASDLVVNGRLEIVEADAITAEEVGNVTASQGIVVANEGVLHVEKSHFNKSGSSRFNTTRLLVQAGGTLEMSDSTMFWEEVHLSPGSTIAPGKVIGNTFAADVYLQATTVPALENNDSFTNVRILGGELTDGNLTLNVMGTNSQADMRFFVQNDLTIQETATLRIGQNVNLRLTEASDLVVNGRLEIVEADAITAEEVGNVTASQGIVVANEGVLHVEKSHFNKSGSSRFNTTRLLVQAGGTLEMSDSTMFWEEVHLNPGSTIAPGKVIGNTFAADVYLQATTVPALENNDSFTNVRILGGELTDGNLTLNVMGTNSQADMRFFVQNDLTIQETATLRIGQNVNLRLTEASDLVVNGRLEIVEADAITAEEVGNVTASQGIVVANEGVLHVEKSHFNKSGSSRFNTTRLLVQAGGTLEMSDSTMFWEEVHLNPGSTIAPGKVIGNTFAADVYLQATTVPALENNDSFTNVRILGGELTDGNLTLNVMGTNSQADMRFFVQNDLTIHFDATLRIGKNVNLIIPEGQDLIVNGRLEIIDADAITVEERGSITASYGIIVNNGGILRAENTRFNISGGSRFNTSRIAINSGGRLTMRNSQVSTLGWEEIRFNNASIVEMRLTEYTGNLIVGNASLTVENNDFSRATVSSTVESEPAVLKRNWWGSANQATIEQKITGLVDFMPPLKHPPGTEDIRATDVSAESIALTPGSEFEIAFGLDNIGSGPAENYTQTEIAFYLSKDGNIDDGAPLKAIFEDAVTPLSSLSGVTTLSLPAADHPVWNGSPAGEYVITMIVDAFDRRLERNEDNNTASTKITVAPPPEIVNRKLFYNNSLGDGNDSTANNADDNALAIDKVAWVGGEVSDSNVSRSANGINGIFVDVANLGARKPTANDFNFELLESPDDTNPLPAPTPAPSIRPGAGLNGSDRITLIWPDQAIRNKWLKVEMRSTASTGLAEPDVFYFRNEVTEGSDPRATDIDLLFALALNDAPTVEVFDLDSDGRHTFIDAVSLYGTRYGVTAGDADMDGDVDFTDFLRLSTNFGRKVLSWSAGDFDGSGEVDFRDFLSLSSNFG